MPWYRIVPGALYTDGVQYTNNDSFEGLYIRNLRSGVQELLSIFRSSLTCVGNQPSIGIQL
jgi:hypothetical protein